MKQLKYILIFAIILVTLLLPVNAATPLDEIQDYTITVNMRPDGTMDIRYYVEWKVLDDSSEGPLEWVKIGNPNKHVDEITALSDNIKHIRYFNEGGAYIRIDFDRAYYKDEIVTFEYTIHQSYMYVIENDSHICRYSFTPGWFNEIRVKNITIKWNAENVIESTAQNTEDGYLIWNSSLGFGERLNASVKYNLDTFTTNENEQYTNDAGIHKVTPPPDDTISDETKKGAVIVLAILLVIVIVACILASIFGDDDDYNSHSGFGGGGRSSTIIVSRPSCVRSSCACVSRCACACACAGGGRAGCSKKDFYRTNLKSDDVKKELEKK